ncbi:MAG: glutathione synthase [Gammaproteobacteria bacterium]
MKLGIIMDPITGINIRKDSSFAMLLAAQARGWDIYYMEMPDLYVDGSTPCARMRRLQVMDNTDRWFAFGEESATALAMLDIILMRKDPPVDMNYIYTTQILDLAQKAGVYVVNDPATLRDVNEKLFVHWFPDCIAPTLITSTAERIVEFVQRHEDIILKPLGNMGGVSVFRARKHDTNLNVIIETLTADGTRLAIAQRFIPGIAQGDKRILLIYGEPVPYALARIPKPGEHRGNLATGGAGKGVELSARDREICGLLGPVLRNMGLAFTGIDVIGDYLTEINITSPTCIRELDAQFQLNIAGDLMNAIEKHAGKGEVRH